MEHARETTPADGADDTNKSEETPPAAVDLMAALRASIERAKAVRDRRSGEPVAD